MRVIKYPDTILYNYSYYNLYNLNIITIYYHHIPSHVYTHAFFMIIQ